MQIKKWILLSLILSGPVLAQNVQSNTRWNTVNDFDLWKVRANRILEDTLWVNAGDTVWTEVVLAWPIMGVAMVSGDTSTVVEDSTKYRVDLYQWFSYSPTPASMAADSARFVCTRSITWHGNVLTEEGITNVVAHGGYAANLTDSPIYPMKFMRFRIIALSGHKVLPGEYVLLYVCAYGG